MYVNKASVHLFNFGESSTQIFDVVGQPVLWRALPNAHICKVESQFDDDITPGPSESMVVESIGDQ